MRLMIDRLIFSLFGGALGGLTYTWVLRQYVVGEQTGFIVMDVVWAFVACILGGGLFYLVWPEIVAFFRMLSKIFQKIMKRLAITDLMILIFALFVTVVVYIFLEPIYRFALEPKLYILVTFLTTPILFIIIWMLGIGKRESIIESTRQLFGSSISQPCSNQHILDSSCLIDGRIAELMMTTTLNGRFAVPSFVLFDLQRISDSQDPILSHRGKRGMMTLEKLQEIMGPKLEVMHTSNRGRQIDLLLKMSRDGYLIISCDMELTLDLRRQGATVVNLNEAASALKTMIVPGEETMIAVIKEGKEQGQGVGFLDDGTMVVIEDGKKVIGQTVRIICTSLLQNPQGRIVFGKIVTR